jgi:hypothetical protein
MRRFAFVKANRFSLGNREGGVPSCSFSGPYRVVEFQRGTPFAIVSLTMAAMQGLDFSECSRREFNCAIRTAHAAVNRGWELPS